MTTAKCADVKRIHLIFKTHLDIGFTDQASNVCRQYHDHFIPQALATGEHFWDENPETPKFIWTTGAWLIHEHLEKGTSASRKRLERAIERGLITWHALPYTTHTELMSAALFEAGLDYGKALDRRFGRRTTAAKMTDVPGHTIGIVPLLASAGVRFLHIGVNAASPVPDVPPVFRWQVESCVEIVVMYQSDYGLTDVPEGLVEGIGFAHTQDNNGPQSIAATVEAHRLAQLEKPEAEIAASTLDTYGDILWQNRDSFPVFRQEIGDSWIHGVGTDPVKVSRYLGLRRLYDRWKKEDLTTTRRMMGRDLGMVAEHTWGVDIKTHLRDETAWDRAQFDRARREDARFQMTEASWAEQRAYVDAALEPLVEEDREAAEAAATYPVLEALSIDFAKESRVSLGGGAVTFDPESGDLTGIQLPNGALIRSGAGPLSRLTYESYDEDDYDRYRISYLTKHVYWSVRDHGKPGLESAQTAKSAVYSPVWQGASRVDDFVCSGARFASNACNTLGAPLWVETRVAFLAPDTAELTIGYFGKPANRMPEASFLTLAPEVDAASWRFRKLGHLVDPRHVITNGSRQLHAVEAVSADLPDGRNLLISPMDSPLVGANEVPFMRFLQDKVSMEQGVRFCLHNNKWGTNFPMWCEGDFVFRFRITLATE
jgi:hypothetical protein